MVRYTALWPTLQSDWAVFTIYRVKSLCPLFCAACSLVSFASDLRVQRHSEFSTKTRKYQSCENPKSQIFLKSGHNTNPLKMESSHGKTKRKKQGKKLRSLLTIYLEKPLAEKPQEKRMDNLPPSPDEVRHI